jgi:hypothetical protein
MLRTFLVAGAGSLLFVSLPARAADALPPPPPPPPGYDQPAPPWAEPSARPKPARPRERAPAPPREKPRPEPSSGSRRPSRPEAFRDKVLVHIHSDQPTAHYQLVDPDFPDPVASCTGSCTMHVLPGHYRLHVSPTSSTRGGTTSVRIEHGSRLDVSPRGYASRWVGLGTAIAGMGTMVSAVAVMVKGGDNSLLIGTALFMTGAAMTPIGWVVFGKSFHPSVRVLAARQDDAASVRLGLGPGGLSFSARF